MKKLKLDGLQVESFETSQTSEVPTPGTVRAHEGVFTRLGERTCGGMSCDYVCRTLYEETCRYDACIS